MIATIDFETTGLKAGEDEVLQVSIIDENYNVLLNAYCRPNNKESWEDAQAVHGITPLIVANLSTEYGAWRRSNALHHVRRETERNTFKG